MFIENADLLAAHRSGDTAKMWELIDQLVSNLLTSREYSNIRREDKEDLRQDVLIACVKALPNIDLSKSDNLFSFLTSMARTTIRHLRMQESDRLKRERTYISRAGVEMTAGTGVEISGVVGEIKKSVSPKWMVVSEKGKVWTVQNLRQWCKRFGADEQKAWDRLRKGRSHCGFRAKKVAFHF